MTEFNKVTASCTVVEDVPPVCTIGETKCEGYDLYECQLVDPLTPDWVLKETNSEACGYVPPPPPPICTLGKTKCEGYDLYECQLVDENPDWVLTEENSTTCGYVPPPPPGTASLEGKITSALYTTPAFSIRVEVAGVGYTESDANGDYKLENIPTGEQTVDFSKAGWLAKQLTLVFAEDESKVQDVQLYLDSREFLEVSMGHPPISGQAHPIGIRGKLAVTSASNSKSPDSKGGIEMDAEVETPNGIYVVEVVDWFYNGYADLDYGVGCIIYNPAGTVVYAERAAVPLGPEVSYELSIYGGTVHVNIASGVIDAHYDCNAQNIRFLATYLEYWWYPVVGTFDMNAYHILESAWHPTEGWKAIKGYLLEPTESEQQHLSGLLGVEYVPYGDFFYIAGTIEDGGIV